MYNIIEHVSYDDIHIVTLKHPTKDCIVNVFVWEDENTNEIEADWLDIPCTTNSELLSVLMDFDEFCDATATAVCYLEHINAIKIPEEGGVC